MMIKQNIQFYFQVRTNFSHTLSSSLAIRKKHDLGKKKIKTEITVFGKMNPSLSNLSLKCNLQYVNSNIKTLQSNLH